VNYNWNWGIFFQPNPMGTGTYLDLLLQGLALTLKTGVLAWIIALILGSIVGVLRTLPSRGAYWFGFAYVEFFRNMPLLVQLFLWYFVLPELLPADLGDWLKQLPNASFYTAVVALGFYTSARIAEQVRAGIQSLSRGQRNAGMAVGLTQPQVYRYVLLPMAFRIIIPPLTSETMNLIKNSSIALTIGLAELTFRSREMGEYTFHFFEAFSAATLVYIVIAMTANRVMAVVERRVAVPGFIVGGGK